MPAEWQAPAERPSGPAGPVTLTETDITGLTPGARPRPGDPDCTIAGCGHPRSHHTTAVAGPGVDWKDESVPYHHLFTCADCDTGCVVHMSIDGVFWPRGARPL